MSNYLVSTALNVAREKNISALDAQILLAYAMNTSREKIIAWPESPLKNEEKECFQNLLCERAQHKPLAYLLGKKEFWSLDLTVSPDVLVPRPETEHLVEEALKNIPLDKPCRVLELATGSGAIACALGASRPQALITASDISKPALYIAEKNIKEHGLTNITLIESDWFSKIEPQQFDVIIANPPYLAEDDEHLEKELLFEPKNALIAGKTGLEAFERIVARAPNYLKPNAVLLLEHGHDQAPALQQLLMQQDFLEVATLNDYAGIPRLTIARMLENGTRPT